MVPPKPSRLGEDPFLRLKIVPEPEEAPRRVLPGQGEREKGVGTRGGKGIAGTREAKGTPKEKDAETSKPPSSPSPQKSTSARKPLPFSPEPSTPYRPAETPSPPLPPSFEQELKHLLEELRKLFPEAEGTLWEEGWEILAELLRYLTPLPYYRAYQELILSSRSLEVDPFGLDPAFEARMDRILRFLYERWWRVEATGVENIPASGRAILVANRGGIFPFDGAMLKLAVRILHPARRSVRFLVENYFYYAPFLGVLLTRYGAIRGSYENAGRLLRTHHLIALFPEGIQGLMKLYRDRYRLQRFGRGGYLKLAIRERAPILPTAIVGSEEIFPLIARLSGVRGPFSLPFFPITPFFPWLGPLGLIPLPVQWRIIVGEPFLEHLRYGEKEIENELLINQLNLKMRRIIHEFLYDELARRRSLFFG